MSIAAAQASLLTRAFSAIPASVATPTNVERRVEIVTLSPAVAIRLNVHFGWSNAVDLSMRNEIKRFRKLSVLMSMFFLVSAIPAMAQVDTPVTFEAPFAFYAGNAKMPAGIYTVTQPDDNAERLLIKSANGSHSVFVEYVPFESDTPTSKTELIFNKYADADFLSRILLQGRTSGMEIPASKAEHNAAKAAAQRSNSVRNISVI